MKHILLLIIFVSILGCNKPEAKDETETTSEKPAEAKDKTKDKSTWQKTKDLNNETIDKAKKLKNETITKVSKLSDEYKEKINKLYEQAKKDGQKVSGDAVTWAKKDLKKVGSFQYKILNSEELSDEELLTKLNALGSNRWEVFWVEKTTNGKKFYLKQIGRSYIKSAGAPAMKLIPMLTPGD